MRERVERAWGRGEGEGYPSRRRERGRESGRERGRPLGGGVKRGVFEVFVAGKALRRNGRQADLEDSMREYE